MDFAYENVHGLDRDRLVSAIMPVLRAHGVDGVELVWRTDHGGWVLEITVELPGSRIPGDGITLDRCSEISRDLSAALDVADLIPRRYRLEVGSPGLERRLYGAENYSRFAGQLVRVKLKQPVEGQRVFRGTLQGMRESGQVVVDTENGPVAFKLELVESARLQFDWKTGSSASRGRNGASSRKDQVGSGAHKPKRSK